MPGPDLHQPHACSRPRGIEEGQRADACLQRPNLIELADALSNTSEKRLIVPCTIAIIEGRTTVVMDERPLIESCMSQHTVKGS